MLRVAVLEEDWHPRAKPSEPHSQDSGAQVSRRKVQGLRWKDTPGARIISRLGCVGTIYVVIQWVYFQCLSEN